MRMQKIIKKIPVTIIIILFCISLAGVIIVASQEELLKNNQIMGKEISRQLAVIEEGYIQQYEALLKTAAKGLEGLLQDGAKNSEIQEWIGNYVNHIENILPIEDLQIYAFIDGKIITKTDWEGESTLDSTATKWYENALKANHEVSYTDIYNNIRLEEDVITLSIQIGDTKNVIALDLYPNQMKNWFTIRGLPEQGDFYLTDTNGKLLYYESDKMTTEEVQGFVDQLFLKIKQEDTSLYDSFVSNIAGKKRGIYYSVASNGWYAIIAIPYSYLFVSNGMILKAYLVVVFVFAVVAILLLIKGKIAEKKQMLYNRIMQALGDSYYAFYLIDLEKETYFMFKEMKEVQESLAEKGCYSQFISYVENLFEEELRQEFREKFSLENMRKVVNGSKKSCREDFRRYFGEKLQWISVQMLYKTMPQNEVILAFQNINDVKERELSKLKIVQDAMESVQDAMESKNTFFSNISHDMRTPLNAIINFSDMILLDIKNEKRTKDYVNKINMASKQLLDLINEVLEFSKVEQGYEKIEKEEFSLSICVEDLMSMFEEQCILQNKFFMCNIDIKHHYVKGDWRKIRQILSNLLSNAIKYTKEGARIVVEIHEMAGEKIPKYEFIVQDTGIGMSQEFLKHIYKPFEREVHFYSGEITGSGLGMTIVYNDVQKLNGEIHVKSKIDKGTTFTVILPIEVVEGQKEEVSELIDETPRSFAGKKVLLVEDNSLNMEISKEFLNMQEIEVVCAWDGKEAISLFEESEENEFDAILMDMKMPVMNGSEATKVIRKLDRKDAKTIPVIAVTANTFAEDLLEMKEAGVNEYISKPIDYKTLNHVLSSIWVKKQKKKSLIKEL